MPSIKDFFTAEEKKAIIQAIVDAEKCTSGEIKIHLGEKGKGEILDRALALFQKLDMHKTDLRNGVLFFLAVDDRQFAVIADEGIHNKVPENFWDAIKNVMQEYFRDGKFLDGLLYGIKAAGNQLQQYFPIGDDDKNEVGDEISFEED